MKQPVRIFSLLVLALLISWQTVGGQGFSPVEAVSKMTVADGLRVKLFASEPMVRQPSFVKCDDRGRVWTIQYLQYPNPAGLERIKVDRWSRTVYDRIPKPPPHGPRGADRITILEDSDGDGTADIATDFVDGLNLVTGVAFGHGGVYVLNVPYLLFYPDRDHDDVPDSDPIVLLRGFGMEDAQSMSNHLTWGPDGWLYGVNGSTTTCRIREVEFQQGLWRFHPLTHQFELFCEGGSNCYGVTFDQNGEVFYSTNGGPFVHAVQGGYFFKSFGKHGPLHNPYAYHFFPNVECDRVPGGPPTGGTIYWGDSFPRIYHGKFIAGNFLGHSCSWWSIDDRGSTVAAKFGAEFLNANDTWFGPTDLCLGPDGSMFVCDFHDQRTAHPDPDANWDRSNGRIYKIEGLQNQTPATFDIRQMSLDQLIDLLSHRNHWFRDRARCELATRRDPSVASRLRAMALQTKDAQVALQGLWSHYVSLGIDDELASELLGHPSQYVRYWAVRLLGDKRQVSSSIGKRLAELARSETSPVVRGQLAASAKRLPGSIGIDMIDGLLKQNPVESDPRIPWLIWWAIESHALKESDRLIGIFQSPQTWENQSARENVFRLIRRYAADGTTAGYDACYDLLNIVPSDYKFQAHDSLRTGLSQRAFELATVGQGDLFQQHAALEIESRSYRQHDSITPNLANYIDMFWRAQPNDLLGLELALRSGSLQATSHLLELAGQSSLGDLGSLTTTINLLSEFAGPEAVPIVLRRFAESAADDAQLVCLSALGKWESQQITSELLDKFNGASPAVCAGIIEILFARPSSAIELLLRVDLGSISPMQIPIQQVRRVMIHDKAKIQDLVRTHWGNLAPGSTEEKLATMRRFNNDLRAAQGDPNAGKLLFEKHCGTCHRLHGIGSNVGPDLTTANRSDRSALLANIVDPSAVVRSQYISHIVQTTSGRILTGLLAEQDAATVTILDAENTRTKIARSEIEDLVPSEVSLMPEKILDQLSPQQLRDLFSYLEQ